MNHTEVTKGDSKRNCKENAREEFLNRGDSESNTIEPSWDRRIKDKYIANNNVMN